MESTKDERMLITVGEIADTELQERAWVGGDWSLTGPDELLMAIEDTNFAHALGSEARLGADTKRASATFLETVSNNWRVVTEDKTAGEKMIDSRWKDIVKAASALLPLLERDLCARYIPWDG
jgi:hypothetical protein